MKKLTSLLLVLICALSMTACGGQNEKKAREAVEGLMDATMALDFAGIEEYIDDASAVPEKIKNFNLDKLMEEMPAELDAYSDEFKGIFNDIIGKAKSNMSYKINNVEEKDGEFTFAVDVAIPDFDSVDFEQIMGDKFNEDAMNTLIMDMFNAGEITATSTQEEILDLFIPKLIEILKESISNIEIKTETEKQELVVTKVDGKWLVNAEKSKLFDN